MTDQWGNGRLYPGGTNRPNTGPRFSLFLGNEELVGFVSQKTYSYRLSLRRAARQVLGTRLGSPKHYQSTVTGACLPLGFVLQKYVSKLKETPQKGTARCGAFSIKPSTAAKAKDPYLRSEVRANHTHRSTRCAGFGLNLGAVLHRNCVHSGVLYVKPGAFQELCPAESTSTLMPDTFDVLTQLGREKIARRCSDQALRQLFNYSPRLP
jgi:hypothetical protein